MGQISKWWQVVIFCLVAECLGAQITKADFSTYDISEYLTKTKTYQNHDYSLAHAFITPIGWSRTGNFAYLISVDAGESGAGYFENFCIKNLVSDDMVFTTNYTVSDYFDGKVLSFFENIGHFSQIIDQFGIVLEHKIALMELPFIFNGDRIAVEISGLEYSHGYYDDDTISKYSIFARKNQQRKLLGTSETNPVMGIEIGGIFKSPFEDRMCVLIAEIRHGWEGPPHTIKVELWGCHLTGGFK